MTDDALLDLVAETARDELPEWLTDPSWDALAAGEATELEVARLRARLAPPAQRREAERAFEPLSAPARGRIVDAILERRSATPARAPAPAPAPRRLPRWRRAWPTAGAILAAAAALVLLLPGESHLPDYALELPLERAERSAVAAASALVVDRARPRTHVAVLRPDTPTDQPIGARAFLARPERWVAWTGPVEVSRDGAVRLALATDVLPPVEAGPWQLVIVVGAVGGIPALPPDPGVDAPGDFRILQAPVEVTTREQ